MKIGFHTDAFNTSFKNFDFCLEWAKKNDVHFIECGVIDGVSWIHGLGYQPHVTLYEDPLMLRNKMAEQYGVAFSRLMPLIRSPVRTALSMEFPMCSNRFPGPNTQGVPALPQPMGCINRRDLMIRRRWIS